MTYGIEDDPVRAGLAAVWVASMTASVVKTFAGTVGGMFEPLDAVPKKVAPLLDGIEAVRREQPLDERALRQAAGAA